MVVKHPFRPCVRELLISGNVELCCSIRDMIGFTAPLAATLFFNVPSPVTDIEISSPGWRKTGGVLPMPTPAGVPVATTSPGCRVWPADRVAMSSGMEKMGSAVDEDCSSLPLTWVWICRVDGRSSFATATGP